MGTHTGANSFSKTRDADLALHPTVKPVKLVADVILDAFVGSGAMGRPAHKTDWRAYRPSQLCIARCS
ncbi:MAG: hypothetical protein AAGC95_04820 [Pseudomonadota bacterium]